MPTIFINPIAVNVSFSEKFLHVVLADGREIDAPLIWFPSLLKANKEQRKNWRFIGRGIGIHWSDVDEDILIESLLATRPL